MKPPWATNFYQMLAVAIILLIFGFSQIATAEDMTCSGRLRSEPKILMSPSQPQWGDLSLTKNVTAYLNLVETLFEEIGKSEADPLKLQIQILGAILQRESPFHLFEMYPNSTSHLLSMLQNSGPLNKMISEMSESDWAQVQLIASEKRSDLERIAENHERREIESDPDFIDSPNLQGRVRLHHLLEKRRYKEAIALLSNPKATTRYINTRNIDGKTPLDFFEDKQIVIAKARNEPKDELFIANQMSLRDQPMLRVTQILIEKSAKTGEELEKLEQDFLNTSKYPKLSWDKIAEQIYERLTWYYQIGGNLDATSDSEPFFNRIDIIFIMTGHLDGLIQLKSLGSDFGYRDKNWENYIHWAATNGQWRIIPFLVKNGVDINAPNKLGRSPIFARPFMATEAQSTIQTLADLGANLNFSDHQGQTPAHVFSHWGHSEQLKALAQYGADLEIPDRSGVTPLMLADNTCPSLLAIFAEYFISKGIDPESRGLYKSKSNPPTYIKKGKK